MFLTSALTLLTRSYTRDSNLPTHPGPVPVPALPSTEMFPYVRSSEQCNTTTHFHCGDGTCLPLQHKCDGTTDCVDGADEKLCESTRALCGSKQWACLTGYQCISTYWRCDGGQDCGRWQR
ncbi:Low-density lipoprotein receptor class A domain-containing protein 3 [Chionoecetes opilio]|uniref:Low-density lipoprotein receptor class A domain-containing protein 3 n=1 Tax=Chionoecetes opilio TaxID=41210 RepID=A0A8J4YH65_CHIOP|nr:Low-density lipoprotein receptor class A domain-containing protein 3 [Chionoecetes opilio]